MSKSINPFSQFTKLYIGSYTNFYNI